MQSESNPYFGPKRSKLPGVLWARLRLCALVPCFLFPAALEVGA